VDITATSALHRRTSRRDFLKAGGVLGAGLLLGAPSLLRAATQETPAGQSSEIYILHTNDLHFHFNHREAVEAFIRDFRARHPDVFLLDAGDIFTRHPKHWPDENLEWYEQRARFMIQNMNELGFDASTLGNHDLSYHGNVTRDVLRQAKFPLLAANVKVNTEEFDQPQPYLMLETKDGRKLGILGLASGRYVPETIAFSDPAETVEAHRSLEEKSDISILLSHLGRGEDLELARRFGDRVDVIVGGHSHTRIDPAIVENGVLVAQTGGSRAELDPRRPFELGVIRLVLDENGKISGKSGQVLLLDAEGVMTPQRIQSWEKERRAAARVAKEAKAAAEASEKE
jgi:2',3'-cyclic-nucleotide 2'-phosphodiesterase (5'-nucleotidase family)